MAADGREAFGPAHGFIAGWCYWVNNLIYYPSLLIFLATNAVFIGGSRWLGLEQNILFVALFSLGLLWIVMLANLRGLRFGKWIQNLGAVGTWVPVLILMGVAGYVLTEGHSATTFTTGSLLPDLTDTGTLSFWATMCFGFAGLELASVLSEEVKDPRRTIPKGIVIAGIMVTVIYILGTLATQIALPADEVSILAGIPQAVGTIFEGTGWYWLAGFTAAAITIGGLGGASAWLGGTARIPYVSGLDHFLPESLGKVHPRYGTPHIAILLQGVLSSLFILLSVIGATVHDAYMVLVDATLILYFIPYLYMFAAVVKLRGAAASEVGVIPIPGGRLGMFLVVGLGLASTLISITFSMVPSDAVASPRLFVAKVVGGTASFMLVGWGLYRHYSRGK